MYHSTHKLLYLIIRFTHPKISKIYRCWIVWGQNIRVVIIPSFLAIVYLGQSIQFHLIRMISIYRPLATWIAPDGATTFIQGQPSGTLWGGPVTLTSLAASMAVNTLVTGLIVLKILTVFLEVKDLRSSEYWSQPEDPNFSISYPAWRCLSPNWFAS
jgi:hypothetical protein